MPRTLHISRTTRRYEKRAHRARELTAIAKEAQQEFDAMHAEWLAFNMEMVAYDDFYDPFDMEGFNRWRSGDDEAADEEYDDGPYEIYDDYEPYDDYGEPWGMIGEPEMVH